jgi:hypothetical protein
MATPFSVQAETGNDLPKGRLLPAHMKIVLQCEGPKKLSFLGYAE